MVTLFDKVEDDAAREVCRDHGDRPDELLEILHDVQREQGFLSEEALRTIAYSLNISRAEIHGVVSFYHDYRREKGAETIIKICRAEACQAVGCNSLIADAEKTFEATLDGENKGVALEAAYCLGNCALGPAAMINDKLYGRVTAEKLKTVISAGAGS